MYGFRIRPGKGYTCPASLWQPLNLLCHRSPLMEVFDSKQAICFHCFSYAHTVTLFYLSLPQNEIQCCVNCRVFFEFYSIREFRFLIPNTLESAWRHLTHIMHELRPMVPSPWNELTKSVFAILPTVTMSPWREKTQALSRVAKQSLSHPLPNHLFSTKTTGLVGICNRMWDFTEARVLVGETF